jgi:hypothetical protein
MPDQGTYDVRACSLSKQINSNVSWVFRGPSSPPQMHFDFTHCSSLNLHSPHLTFHCLLPSSQWKNAPSAMFGASQRSKMQVLCL